MLVFRRGAFQLAFSCQNKILSRYIFQPLVISKRFNSSSEKPKFPDNNLKDVEGFCSGSSGKKEDTINGQMPGDEKSEQSDPIQDKDQSKPNQEQISQISLDSINKWVKDRINDLPSQRERKRNEYAKKLEVYMDSLQETIFKATRTLNDVTGYSAIEKLKKSIDSQEEELQAARNEVKKAKEAYTSAIQKRSSSQKEVNELLQRKHNWSHDDLERFTELYRNDHANERGEKFASSQLEKAEQYEDDLQVRLTQSILTRYHEEQIWSDKIRRASTWGTSIIMGINVFLFVVVQLILEPWKRKRLVGSFEDKVKQALQEMSEEQSFKLDEMKNFINVKPDVVIIDTPSTSTELVPTDTESDIEDANFESQIPTYHVSFRVPESTWYGLKNTFMKNYIIITSKDTNVVQFDKIEFGIISGVTIGFGCILGSIVTSFFR